MARATLCLACGMPTTNGSRCVPCNRGFRRAVHNPAYDQPAWRKRSKRDIAAHVARHGRWCPGIGVPPHPSTDLTSDHIDPLALGGAVLGETQVLCRGCNTRKRWAQTPTRRAARTGGGPKW